LQQYGKRIGWDKKTNSVIYLFTSIHKQKIFMDFSALLVTIFLGSFLISITGYSFYVGFGPPSKELRDPFLEHED